MERGEKRHTRAHTQTHKKGRTICDGWEPCDWSGDRKRFLFVWLVFYPITGDVHQGGKLLQSSGVISIHVRREGNQIHEGGKKERKERQRERKQNKRHTIRKLKIFEIHNLVSFCITKKRGQKVDRQSVNPVRQFFHLSTAVHVWAANQNVTSMKLERRVGGLGRQETDWVCT